MKYIVYQYLLTINETLLPYELLILKENGIFGARFDWSCYRENCRLKKKLTKKIVRGIYDSCIKYGTAFDKFDYTETPDHFIDDVKELFSLNTREKRIQKLQRFDELWGEKKLIYYQEI
jgi:hypothetical protein